MATPALIIPHHLPVVALVGRVNVGKSSLFNRITDSRQAIVSDIPGTTRTRNVATPIWRGENFVLVDTGGLTFDEDVPLEEQIIRQTELAIKEADVIVLVVDAQNGLLPQERELAKRLMKIRKLKPILLIANKADTKTFEAKSQEKTWLSLGFGQPLPVSAANGRNIGDFLDQIYDCLQKCKKNPAEKEEFQPIKVALMGKPNVGKSSLFNQLIGEERVIVSDMPHTTREPHDTLVEAEGQHVLFIDTAGIRRKTRVSGELERIGIGKSIEIIKRADIVLLVLDANEAISDQDQQLAGLLRESTKSVIIVVNKWDLAEDNDDSFRNDVKEKIYKKFPHLDFCPIVFVSAKTSYRVHQIFPLIFQAWTERQTVVGDEALREFMKGVVKRHLPTRGKGVRHPKIMGFTQINSAPPIFEMFIKSNTSLHISYVHFIENQLRKQFPFFAAPIVIKLTKMRKEIKVIV